MNKLHIELPTNYEAFARHNRRDGTIAVELYWKKELLDVAQIMIEAQSLNPADDPDADDAWANAREFSRRCAAIHATINAGLGEYGLHNADSGMRLGWQYPDGRRWLDVEISQRGKLLLAKNYPLPPAVRDFDAGREDVTTLTRAALQAVLDDWWRLVAGDTAFPGTFAAVMGETALSRINSAGSRLDSALRRALPEFVYRLCQQPGGVQGIYAVPWPGVPGEACLLFFGDLCERRLYLHINGNNAWGKCRDNPQAWGACIRDEAEMTELLHLFADIFHLERQDGEDNESSGVLRYRRRQEAGIS